MENLTSNIEDIKINQPPIDIPPPIGIHPPPIDISIGGESDFLFDIYESSLVYWCILVGILGIIYISIIIYLKKTMGDKWKDGILKWMMKWYLDKTETQIKKTKHSELLTPLFETIKKNTGME
jgi:hypothetical protein